MDSCNGLKRLFELESCASRNQERSQNEANRVEDKGQRRALESSEDSFEEFVALMNRIQHMKTNDMNFRSLEEEISVQEDLEVKVIKTKSPGLPSFEWEDFCVPAKRDTSSLHTRHDRSSTKEMGKQRIGVTNYFKMDSSSDSYESRPAESFDLNVEPSSNICTL